MPGIARFAQTAALVGDIARATMLIALMDGRALTATELARAAAIMPQTASGHLAKLVDAGMLAVQRQGRHRYYRLASPAVAQLVENLMSATTSLNAQGGAVKKVVTGPRDRALRHARTCYDHLAGEVAVAMADHLIACDYLELVPDGASLTDNGMMFLRDLGVDLGLRKAAGAAPGKNRVFCRTCLDWSERRPHIAGVVGKALCQCFLTQGWARRIDKSRAVAITPAGYKTLNDAFGIARMAKPLSPANRITLPPTSL
jgi:DNA-binding transcriptional ArsR family regulator